MGIFTNQKLANVTYHSHSLPLPQNWLLNLYQHTRTYNRVKEDGSERCGEWIRNILFGDEETWVNITVSMGRGLRCLLCFKGVNQNHCACVCVYFIDFLIQLNIKSITNVPYLSKGVNFPQEIVSFPITWRKQIEVKKPAGNIW